MKNRISTVIVYFIAIIVIFNSCTTTSVNQLKSSAECSSTQLHEVVEQRNSTQSYINSVSPIPRKPAFLYKDLVYTVIRIEEHQSVCTHGLSWGLEKDVSIGSAFFIYDSIINNKGKEEGRLFIVTARHVVEKKYDLFARIRSIDSQKNLILRLPKKLWIFHPAPPEIGKFPIDVAVMQLPLNNIVPYAFFNYEKPSYSDISQVMENQLSKLPTVMEHAIFFGFPDPAWVPNVIAPFVRSGIISYTGPFSNLVISGQPCQDEKMFYIDAVSLPGNSGGPVIQESPLFLLGLVSAGNTGNGYAIITSVERIRETIQYARNSEVNLEQWSESIPPLPIQCTSDKPNG